MEDVFEAILAICLVIFAIARKSKKQKAAGQKSAPVISAAPVDAPDAPREDEPAAKKDVLDTLLKALDVDVEDMVPDAPPPAPAAAVPPVPPVPPAPPVAVKMEEKPEPSAAVTQAPRPKPVPRAPKKRPDENNSPSLPRRYTACDLRRAVVTAEILKKPVALRPRGYRT